MEVGPGLCGLITDFACDAFSKLNLKPKVNLKSKDFDLLQRVALILTYGTSMNIRPAEQTL